MAKRVTNMMMTMGAFACACVLSASPLMAQPPAPAPKPPAIDLEKTARTPRAGQPVAKSKEQLEAERKAKEEKDAKGAEDAAASGGTGAANVAELNAGSGSEVGPDGRRIRPPVTPLPVDAPRIKETTVKAPVVPLDTSQGKSTRIGTDPFARRFAEMSRIDAAFACGAGDGSTQWRRAFAGGAKVAERWRAMAAGGEAEGTIDVRTGTGDGAAATVNGKTSVEVKRLTRARLGVMDTGTGDASARRIVIELYRGLVVVRPEEGTVVTVATPDATVQVREGTSVWYDAGLGTRTAVAR